MIKRFVCLFVLKKEKRHNGTWTKKITMTFWKLERRMSGNCDPADQKLYLKQPERERRDPTQFTCRNPQDAQELGNPKSLIKEGEVERLVQRPLK